MSLQVELEDGRYGTKNKAGVTARGQLVTAPIAFNEPVFNAMTIINTAYNFVTPVEGRQFIIDGFIVSSDKNVSTTNGAVVQIFETNAVDSITSTNQLLVLDIGRLDREVVTGLNLVTNRGVWINAVTDDTNINLTILGYYVDVV